LLFCGERGRELKEEREREGKRRRKELGRFLKILK